MAQLIHYHLSDTYSFSQIAGMDRTGILFDNGQSIFFEECYRNFSRAYPENSGKCVAERNAAADVPYYEFYTCGKSMIVRFDGLGKHTQRVFREFQEALRSYGLTTYDLS